MKLICKFANTHFLPKAMNVQRIFALTLSIIFSLSLMAQRTLTAQLLDIELNEPVAFANVLVKHTKNGCLSQLDGRFSLRVPLATDTVLIESYGYHKVEIAANTITADTLTIYMKPAVSMMDAVVVLPGKNPAIPIVKRAIENRKTNKPQAIKDIEFMEYNKLNFAISDLDSSTFDKLYFKKNPNILVKLNDYDNHWSVPLYFSERLSYQKNRAGAAPITEDVVVNQHGSSFIDSDIVNKYIASLNDDMTFYGNLRFLYRDFVSPIMPQALLYYKYMIVDSLEFNEQMFYKLRFKPRNSRDLAFYGEMVIEIKTGALLEIDATLQSTANLNYVKSIHLQEKMQQLPSGEWFFKQHSMHVEFTPQLSNDTTNNLLNTPLLAMKSTSYIVDSLQIQNYLNNKEVPKKFNLVKRQAEIDTSLLVEVRPESLSSIDLRTKDAIERTNEISSVKAGNALLDMFLYGYFKLGYIDLGPYLYFVQNNEIEGTRLNLAARTSAKFSEDIMLSGYVGYGIRDRKFKYGGKFSLRVPLENYTALHLGFDQNIYRIGDYKQNLDFIRENVLVQSDDNLMNAILTHDPNKAVYFVRKAKAEMEYQISENLIVKPLYGFSRHYSPPFYPFDTINNIRAFNLHEVGCDFRISFNEKISTMHFRRVHVDSHYPVFHFNVMAANYRFNNINQWYSQFRFVARQHVFLGVGRFSYVLESGLTTAPVPFSLLEFHRGNQTGGSGEYYFNLMRYMEFASDRFVNLFAEYNLQGYFFNKIPIIKRLNLRELLTLKACWGDLKHNHNSVLQLPENSFTFNEMPYLEAGVGITNLLKVLRVEYIWRLNYRNNPDISKRGFFFRFQIEF